MESFTIEIKTNSRHSFTAVIDENKIKEFKQNAIDDCFKNNNELCDFTFDHYLVTQYPMVYLGAEQEVTMVKAISFEENKIAVFVFLLDLYMLLFPPKRALELYLMLDCQFREISLSKKGLPSMYSLDDFFPIALPNEDVMVIKAFHTYNNEVPLFLPFFDALKKSQELDFFEAGFRKIERDYDAIVKRAEKYLETHTDDEEDFRAVKRPCLPL